MDNVQKMMNDTEEARVYHDEINAMLGEKLSSEDEEEILEELEDLEAHLGLEDLTKAPTTVPSTEQEEDDMDLPDVQTKVPTASGIAEEEASSRVATGRKVMEEPQPA